jgi:hypothetical protein
VADEKRLTPQAVAQQVMEIFREGDFQMISTGENRCGTVDRFDVKYRVDVVTDKQLDERGFIVDQLDIHNMFVERFTRVKDMSCERVVQAMVAATVELVLQQNPRTNLHWVRVELVPFPFKAGISSKVSFISRDEAETVAASKKKSK